jgi:plastocyanin
MKGKQIVFILLISAFLAIGCTGYNSEQEPTTPVNETSAVPTNATSGTSANETPAAPTNETVVTPVNETPAIPTNETTTTAGKTVEVSIEDFAFKPKSVKISVGDTVKWTNLDSASHTVAATDFTSEVLSKNGVFSYTFSKAGIYNYRCSIHPSMNGIVIVE